MYQSVLAKQQGSGSSGIGFAFKLVDVKDLHPESNICLVADVQTAESIQVGLDKRDSIAWPQIGDRWIIDRSLGHWALRCRVTGTSAPAFTGSRNTVNPALVRLVGVLEGLGLIDDQTTAQTVPVGIWAPVLYTSPWADFSGTYQGVRYMLDYSGFVVIEGAAKTTATIAAGTSAVFTLPPGYRPQKIQPFTQISGTTVRQMEVTGAGVVQFTGMPNATVTSATLSCRFSVA